MIKRRDFLIAGAAVTAAALHTRAAGAEDAAVPAAPADGWDDGLAHAIPYTPPLGTGLERGLVLGGGGAYLASWMVGYFDALKKNGIDVADADIIVGTSAGSVVGASLAGGHPWRLSAELDFLGKFPKLFAELIPTMAPNPSQTRARHIADAASDADPATIQAIGRAAMAAENPAGPSDYW